MKIIKGLENVQERFTYPVLTMGNFDGVHLGHQKIFELVRNRAREVGGTSIVLTFDPHPQKVLFPEKEFFLLNTLEEKIQIIEKIGIDVVICARFTREFANKSSYEFVKEILHEQLGVQEVYVGYDSTFGKGREGDTQELKYLGEKFGFKVVVVPPVQIKGKPVSSTRIRKLLKEGNVEEAALLLNRRYSIDGEVIQGKALGKKLGFPTANLKLHHELIPKEGIYIVGVLWRNKLFKGALNIGFNPTFPNEKFSVEVHILDFDQDIYGERIKIIFYKRIRDEIAFSSVDELVRQIGQDVEITRKYFAELEAQGSKVKDLDVVEQEN
jgi:riboflavin kinase/FMN adenylyltransferase